MIPLCSLSREYDYVPDLVFGPAQIPYMLYRDGDDYLIVRVKEADADRARVALERYGVFRPEVV